MNPPVHAMDTERQLLLAEIAEFNAAYAHCIDDDQLEQWPDYFTEVCEYRIIPRENVDLGFAQGQHQSGSLQSPYPWPSDIDQI